MELDPTGMPVDLDGVVLATPGLQGNAEVHYGGGDAVRSLELTAPAFRRALDAAEVDEQLTVVIHDPLEVPGAETVPTRSTRSGLDGIEITVPGPGTGLGQMLLAVGENGALSWHVAPAGDGPAVRGAGDTRTYVVPRRVAPDDGAAPTRGILGAVGKKLFKVMTFDLIDRTAGAVGDYFVRRWEAEHRRHRLRMVSSGNVADPAAPDLSAADLRALGGRRALLFVHGTGSRTHAAFATIPTALLDDLHERYEGRVLGFDHPTVGSTPTENLAWLGEQLSAGDAALDIDIVAHSRGGLVARMLAERPGDGAIEPAALTVRTIVFVATPNAGTALAAFDRLGDHVDRLTNLLDLLPDNPITDPLTTIIAIVKQFAVGALNGLDGLTCMTPDGDFLKTLNAPCQGTPVYRAVASNFDPAPGSSLATIARDAGTDLIFGDAQNDLVVPTNGVFDGNGGSLFPISEPVVLGAPAAISHSAYWPHAEVVDALDRWLTG